MPEPLQDPQNVEALEKQASDALYKHKQGSTKLRVAGEIAGAVWGVVSSVVTGNVISAVVEGVQGVAKVYNTLHNSGNINYAASRVIVPANVDKMSIVLQDALGDPNPIIDKIAKKFGDNELKQFDKRLRDNKLTVQDVQDKVNAKAPREFEKIQYAIQNLPQDKQYEISLCVTDRGMAALYVAALAKAKQVRDAQSVAAKVQKEAAKIAKEAFKQKEPGTHTASEIIKHYNSFDTHPSPPNPTRKSQMRF